MDDQRFDRLARIIGNRHSRRQAIAAGVGVAIAGVGLRQNQAEAGTVCLLTCPVDVVMGNDPNQCGAVSFYPAPTTVGACGTITCSPPSGSFFPSGVPGETTVTCTSTVGPTCSFTVSVTDIELPTITCPFDIDIESADPIAVNYAPVASDNCPGVTTFCNPPSGSVFGPGTTNIVCSALENAPDQSTVTCNFNINVTVPPTATSTATTEPTDPAPTVEPTTGTTEVPATVAPTSVPGVPTATTAPVTELPNTGAGEGGSGAGKLLPVAAVGAGAALLARLGLRSRTATPTDEM